MLQDYVQRFPPYSDFNVWNKMGWASQDHTAYSFLNGNLILRSWDYYTNKDVFSLLGTNRIDDTLRELCNMTSRLELIPEVVVQNILTPQLFKIEEDRDNHDYILSTEKLINLSGNHLYSIRTEVSRFPKNFPDNAIRLLDFSIDQDYNDVIGMTESWCKKKELSTMDIQGEIEGVVNFMKYSIFFRGLSLGLYVGTRMVGFSINEIINDITAITHFAMGDMNYEGSSRYLTHATAKLLHQRGCMYLNYEQDMGIPGLRFAKQAYCPIYLLKKYKIYLTA